MTLATRIWYRSKESVDPYFYSLHTPSCSVQEFYHVALSSFTVTHMFLLLTYTTAFIFYTVGGDSWYELIKINESIFIIIITLISIIMAR